MKLLAAITVFSSLLHQAASECPVEDLDNSVDIPDAPATFYYTIGDGVLMACLEAETDDSVGWMAVGFSDNGMMVTTMSDTLNHTAAIGGWGPDVTKYALITKGGKQAPAALQTLTDASYVKEDGMSTLMFTKPLVEEGEVPIIEDGENIFIYAWGPSGGKYRSVYIIKQYMCLLLLYPAYILQSFHAQHMLLKGFHTTYGNIKTGGDEVEEEAEPATNDEVADEDHSGHDHDEAVPDVDEPATNDEVVPDVAVDEPAATLADSAAFSNNVLAAGIMASMGFAATLLL